MTAQARYSPAQLAMLLGLPEPTGEQAAVIAAPLEPLAVIAGAGSGKSETMAARLVWLVANGMVAPERVLGLTFTRKAAAELGQRVRTRLAGLRRAGLAGGTAAGGRAGAAAGRGVPAWRVPGRRVRGRRVTGWRLPGRRARWACLPERCAPAVRPGGMSLDGLLPRDGLLRADAGPAGPGGPAAEDAPEGEPVVSTYHAYAARLVADHALREALEPSLRLITPAVAWQIAARVVAAYSGPMDAIDRAPQWVTAAVLDLAAELAEHLRTPADVHQVGRWLDTACQTLPGRVPALVRKITACQRTREQLLPIVAAYAQAKAAREVIDYGDQVALAARIASRHPQVGAIERARYQVVLLDEYQDTSHAQLVLLQALFGGGHPVTAVGDPCQSIYGWRGASAGNLRRFVADFPVAGGNGNGPGMRAAPGPPRSGSCPPASATPGACWTPPPPCSRGCAPRRRRCRGWSRPRGGPGGGGWSAPCWTPRRTRRPGSRHRSRGCWTCRRARPRTGTPGPITAAPASARPTSRCSAASGPSSRCCGPPSRRAGSRSKWSAWAGCSPSPRWPTWSRPCGCCTTRPRPARWRGC